MKLFEFNGPSPSAAPPQPAPTASAQDPKARAGAAAISRALGGKVDTKFAQAIDKAEQGKTLNPTLLKSIAPFAGALEKIFADPAMRTKFLAMVKTVQAEESINEDQDSVDAVAGAVTRRIMSQHLDILSKYGPGKVLAAIDDVAQFAGGDGLDEIGSSDVSIWTKQVIQDLESGHFDHMESVQEEEQLDEFLPALGAAVGRAVVGAEAGAVTRGIAGGVGRAVGTMASDALDDSDEDPTDADSKGDAVDTVTLDVPLMIRMMEYAREDAKDDMDLHDVAERLIALSKDGPLTMDDYDSIVGDVEALPAPDQIEEEYGMWKVEFPKQHAGKDVDAGTVHVKAQNTAHAHKVAAKRVGVNPSLFKTTVTKSSILPENYYTPGPETMPGAVGPQENTTVSFNQSKTVGDATLNISASAKDMEELHRILKLAGIDYNATGEERPTMKDVAVALAPHMPAELGDEDNEPCGCDDAEVAMPMVPGPKPLDYKYTTDKTALINAIKDKLAKRLS